MIELKLFHVTSLPTDSCPVTNAQLDQPARVDKHYHL